MSKIRWQLVIILLTGLVVGVLLLTQKAPPSAQVNPNTPEPATGGVYTEAVTGSLKRLNPLLDIYNPPDQDIDRLIYSSLVKFDSQGLPQPDLAEKWGISNDGTIYNFMLRKGVSWHDGQPVTADDVAFTFNLLKSESSLVPADLQAFWKDIEIKKLDGQNVQFRLPEAFSPFMDYLSIGILPSHLLGAMTLDKIADAKFNIAPIGTGPFRFDRLIVENDEIKGVVLSANTQYFGKKPYIQQFVFRYYPNADAAFSAYEAGEVQGISQVPLAQLPRALSEPNLALYTGRQPDLTLVLFNLKSDDLPFFQDAKVRQALYQSLNRQWMIDHLMQGQAILANGPLFPGTWAYYSGLQSLAYESGAATNLLKAAGYTLPTEGEKVWTKGEKQLAFQMLYPDSPEYQNLAEEIQQEWNTLGVKVTIEAVPYDQLISDRLAPHDFQAALIDLNLTRVPDPDPYPFWDQAQIADGQNYSQWNDRVSSEYLEQARITHDITERAKYYRNFQMLFNREIPALPLFYPVYTYAVDRQVEGVSMGPLIEPSDRFATVTEWHVLERKTQNQAPLATATP